MKWKHSKLFWLGSLVAGLLLLAIFVEAFLVLQSEKRLQAEWHAVRAAGDPTQLIDFARTPVPPEKNSWTYLDKASQEIQHFGQEITEIDCASTPPRIVVPPAELKVLQATFAAHPQVIELLRQSSECEVFDLEIEYKMTIVETLNACARGHSERRNAARALCWHAKMLRGEGRNDESVQDVLLLYRLTRLWDQSPSLVDWLVNDAVRDIVHCSLNETLRSGSVSVETRQLIDAELARQESLDRIPEVLRHERVSCLLAERELTPWYRQWLLRSSLNFQDQQRIRCIQILIDIAERREPFSDKKQHLAPHNAMILEAFDSNGDAWTRVFAWQFRQTARIRCLRILNALQAKGLAEAETLPDLSKLELPPETLIDSFDGQLMRLKHLPTGWVIYSIGQNLVDDGGKIDGVQEDIGCGPPALEVAANSAESAAENAMGNPTQVPPGK